MEASVFGPHGKSTLGTHPAQCVHVTKVRGQLHRALSPTRAICRLVQEANDHPSIRFMTTRKLTASSPLAELPCTFGDPNPAGCTEERWSRGNNVSVSDDAASHLLGAVDVHSRDDNWLYMSAVCYLYGLELHRALGVPVGLINTNWGGTVIEDWLPAAGNAQCAPGGVDDVADSAERVGRAERAAKVVSVEQPPPAVGRAEIASHLFNAMVAPLLNHTIKGVIWYQCVRGQRIRVRGADARF